MKKGNKLIGAGLLTAFAASLCCITPILALVAGSSGLASSFSWLEPMRPYLIGLTFVVLGLAWFQKFRPKKKIDCCEPSTKTKFVQSKTFLGLVTVLAVLMLAFPYYAHVFYSKPQQTQTVDISNVQTIEFEVNGMTCTGCEEHVIHGIYQLDGIIQCQASFEEEKAIVQFDSSQASIAQIENAILNAGYSVTGKKEN